MAILRLQREAVQQVVQQVCQLIDLNNSINLFKNKQILIHYLPYNLKIVYLYVIFYNVQQLSVTYASLIYGVVYLV